MSHDCPQQNSRVQTRIIPTMLLTITTTHKPATDLGYLLHKNPERMKYPNICGSQSSASISAQRAALSANPARAAAACSARGRPVVEPSGAELLSLTHLQRRPLGERPSQLGRFSMGQVLRQSGVRVRQSRLL